MLLTHLFYFICVYLYRSVDASIETNKSCPSFSYFVFWTRRMCPVMDDLICVANLPVDVTPHGILNCGTVDDHQTSALNVLNATVLLETILRKDQFGRPWCMLSLFYSSECVFSAKVAETFYRIAPLFPKLLVVAIDVSVKTKEVESLVNHFGIASTPVMALWESGVPRFRLYDDYSKIQNLIRVIQTQTDLRIRNVQNEDKGTAGILTIALNDNEAETSSQRITLQKFLSQFKYLRNTHEFDWYLFVATITLFFNTLYFILNSPKALNFIRAYTRRFIL